MKTIQRIPRPLGTTALAHNLNKERSKHNLALFRKAFIQAHINNQLWYPYLQETHMSVRDEAKEQKLLNQWKESQKALKASKASKTQLKQNKKPIKKIYKKLHVYNVEQVQLSDLALWLGLSNQKVMDRIDKLLTRQGEDWFTQQGQIRLNSLARAAQNEALKLSLGMVPKASDWAEELKAVARLKGYAPGHIMGANTALNQQLQVLNQVANMAAKFGALNGTQPGKLSVNIQNNNGTQQPTHEGQYLTATMAQKMLQEQGLTKVPLDLEALGILHGIHGTDLPDIQAIPRDAQGTVNFALEDLIMEPSEPRTHDTRREEELNIQDGESM